MSRVPPLLLALVFVHIVRADDNWQPLLNGKDFTGWETYLGKPHNGKEAIGLNKDPHGVFQVVQLDGAPAIRISGHVIGTLTTLKEYGDYWLRLEFKWGEKKWPPEEKNPRNSGVLYHCFGPHGAIVGMCMRSHEFQIKEKECGDYWSSDAIVDVEGDPSADPKETPHRFKPGGKKFTVHDPLGDPPGRVAHLKDYEKPHGQWNKIDLVCLGGKAIHAVNGKVTMMVTNSRRKSNGKEEPLTRGKIQLLSEGAEVYFRKIEWKPITEIPEAYRKVPKAGS